VLDSFGTVSLDIDWLGVVPIVGVSASVEDSVGVGVERFWTAKISRLMYGS